MEQIFLSVINYLALVVLTTGLQLFVLIGPGLVLAFLIHQMSRLIQRAVVSLSGKTLYLVLFGWLGVVIHELGHALFSIFAGHRIVAMKLFELDPQDGTYGYVYHTYDKGNVYQVVGNFFVGVGPILLGTVVIYWTAWGLLGRDVISALRFARVDMTAFSSFETLSILLQSILSSAISLVTVFFSPEQLGRWEFYLFLYIALSVSSAITLSPADLMSTVMGARVFVVLLLLLNLLTLWLGNFLERVFFLAAEITAGFYGVMLFVLLLTGLLALFLTPLSFFLGSNN